MSEQVLDPGAIATRLMLVRPDRDQRASQLFVEFLLTLAANAYVAPASEESLRSPKVRRFALRSLVLGRNFLEGYDGLIPGTSMRIDDYGRLLARGQDVLGSSHLDHAHMALHGLIDPSTQTGVEPGQYLLMPFHEALLWYDARRTGTRFTVRKVRMRGAGITLARALLDPPATVSSDTRALGRRAATGVQAALDQSSPLSEVARGVESLLPPEFHDEINPEEDEVRSWHLGASPAFAELSERISRHTEGIIAQEGASGPARLWQMRTILTLDLATDMLRRCWSAIGYPSEQQHLLLALPGRARRNDRVRRRSELSWANARSSINWATISTIEAVLRDLDAGGDIAWNDVLNPRTEKRLRSHVTDLYDDGLRDYRKLAQLAFENANYDRPVHAFRLLLETIGMSAGGTRYRYFSATPDVLSACVGALSSEMPLESERFFDRMKEEWNIVVSPRAAIGTTLAHDLDGDELTTNIRRFERLLIESGLASGLSDRTVLVGERASRGTE